MLRLYQIKLQTNTMLYTYTFIFKKIPVTLHKAPSLKIEHTYLPYVRALKNHIKPHLHNIDLIFHHNV